MPNDVYLMIRANDAIDVRLLRELGITQRVLDSVKVSKAQECDPRTSNCLIIQLIKTRRVGICLQIKRLLEVLPADFNSRRSKLPFRITVTVSLASLAIQRTVSQTLMPQLIKAMATKEIGLEIVCFSLVEAKHYKQQMQKR